MVDFSFLPFGRLHLGLDENGLNGYNFLVEVSEVRIFLVEHLIHHLYVIRWWNIFHHDETGHEVAQLTPNLLAVVRLVSWDALVHWILRQESQILVWVAAGYQPLHFKVRHHNLIPFFREILLHLSVVFEAMGLVVGVRLSHHSGNSLDQVLSFEGENEDDILNGHERMTQLGLGHFGCWPCAVGLRLPEVLRRYRVYNEVSCPPFK